MSTGPGLLARRFSAVAEGVAGTRRQVGGLALVVLGVAAFGWWITGPLLRGRWADAGVIGLVFLWYLLSLILRNRLRPGLARLVPGYRDTWRRAALAGFTGALLALVGLQVSTGARWSSALFVGAMLLALLTWASQARWLMLALGSFVPALLFALPWGRDRPWWTDWLDPLPAWLVLAWTLLWMAWLWRRLDPRLGRSRAGQVTWGPFTLYSFYWLMPLWREYLLRHARPTPASVLARAELVVLRERHWTATWSAVLPVVAATPLLLELMGALFHNSRLPMREVWQPLPGLLLFLLAMSGALAAFGLSEGMFRRRREQALLMLLPGMPRGAALNRQLALRAWLQMLMPWVAGMLIIALHDGVQERVQRELFHGSWIPGAMLLTPSLVVLAWRDWSRMRGWNLGRQQLALAPMFVAGYFIGTWMLEAHWPWWAWLVLGLLPALALAAWRWGQLSRWSTAWPAGRWAGAPGPRPQIGSSV